MKKAISKTVPTQILFTFDGLGPIVFDATKVSRTCRAHAEMHGWLARIGDAAALSRKQADGTVVQITEAMRQEEVLAIVAHYESGGDSWTMGARAQAPNPFFIKLAEQRGCTVAEAAAWYQEKLLADMQALIDGEAA